MGSSNGFSAKHRCKIGSVLTLHLGNLVSAGFSSFVEFCSFSQALFELSYWNVVDGENMHWYRSLTLLYSCACLFDGTTPFLVTTGVGHCRRLHTRSQTHSHRPGSPIGLLLAFTHQCLQCVYRIKSPYKSTELPSRIAQGWILKFDHVKLNSKHQ